jgi:hypothetical protein
MISPLGATTSATTMSPSSATTMSPSSTASQTTNTSCVGVPGNINSTGITAGSTAGSC